MSDGKTTVNFRDDEELQEAFLAKCERLGTSRSEVLREFSRRFVVDDTDYNSPEELLGRAETLEEEAAELDEEADEHKERAASARERAEMLREEARDLREKAEATVPYEERIDDLAEFLLEDDDRRLFSEHGLVREVAETYGESCEGVLADVQELTGLPDYRFIAGGEPGDS